MSDSRVAADQPTRDGHVVVVATGPARDELVVHTEVWSPDDYAHLAAALAGKGEPSRRP